MHSPIVSSLVVFANSDIYDCKIRVSGLGICLYLFSFMTYSESSVGFNQVVYLALSTMHVHSTDVCCFIPAYMLRPIVTYIDENWNMVS